MAKEPLCGLMGANTKDSIPITRSMGMEYILIKMELCIRGNLKMIYKMELEFISLKMEPKRKDSGKMENY